MSAAPQSIPTNSPPEPGDPLAERLNPLELRGSQFLEWVRDHLRDEAHTIRHRERSARDRGMSVDYTRLEASDAFAAAEDAMTRLLHEGDTPSNRRMIAAMRAAVTNERSARGAKVR
jgi:hypothetical protein